MSTPIALQAERREQPGTRVSRRLRREGKLPAVVYGHGEQSVTVTLPGKETIDAIRHGAHVFELKLDGKAEQVLVKEVQYDHLGDEMLHVDLFRVNPNEVITSEVPIVLVGEAKGVVEEGGILTQMRDQLEIQCKVSDLPDDIRVDISDLAIGDAVHVNELPLPAGVSLPPHDADFTIVTVVAQKRKLEDDVPETGAEDVAGEEPEIIGDKESSPEPEENPTAEADNA